MKKFNKVERKLSIQKTKKYKVIERKEGTKEVKDTKKKNQKYKRKVK